MKENLLFLAMDTLRHSLFPQEHVLSLCLFDHVDPIGEKKTFVFAGR